MYIIVIVIKTGSLLCSFFMQENELNFIYIFSKAEKKKTIRRLYLVWISTKWRLFLLLDSNRDVYTSQILNSAK